MTPDGAPSPDLDPAPSAPAGGSCCAASRTGVTPGPRSADADVSEGTEGTEGTEGRVDASRTGTRAHPWAAPVVEARARSERAVLIEAGAFRMGTEDADRNSGDGESPIRSVEVPAFRIDPTCVTNAEFAAFVDDTGYITEAEEYGWSFVFGSLLTPQVRRASQKPPGTPWWRAVQGAFWDSPEGPGSDAGDRPDHPVVHVSLRDAEAFAGWCGMRLPTESEWEKAARGGLDQARYAWGDELTEDGEHRCNIWQGAFPVRNTLEDGFLGTAPVRSFPPNGFGLYEVAGNVWEWCSDTWSTGAAASMTGDVRVMRGGSYLCHDSYCNRYRVAARSSTAAEDASGNKGFRLAADA